MIAIYIHIPFCKQACHYCNFHFSTNLSGKSLFVNALLREIALRKDEFEDRQIASVYFGGGTPSLLNKAELTEIFSLLRNTFEILPDAEITLEANPDDINESLLRVWRDLSVNRLSLGIQSFQSDALKWMNRAHTGVEAINALNLMAEAGFENMTADLIYGIPGVTDDQWLADISELINRGIPHISAYCLTVEDQTALAHFIKKGTSPPVQEEQANRHFDLLMETLTNNGYQHYEISNFAKPGWEAKHNSSYWLGMHYMGFGPSAHSYNGKSRFWNVANNHQYIKGINEGKLPVVEMEVLTDTQKYNEYILTRLRTHWGCNPEEINEPFRAFFLEEVKPFIPEMVYSSEGSYFLTKHGKMWADRIASQLFATEK